MPRHYKMTDQEKRDRRWARKKILATANRISDTLGYGAKPYYSSRIHQAVCVVRRRGKGLISADDLKRAGFNPE